MLIHEGGIPTGDYNECPGISGPIVDIVEKLDKAVDLVISGHTHRAYNCLIDGRLVTSADKYGTIVTEIEMVLDPKTRDVASAKADNLIVRTDAYAKDARADRADRRLRASGGAAGRARRRHDHRGAVARRDAGRRERRSAR